MLRWIMGVPEERRQELRNEVIDTSAGHGIICTMYHGGYNECIIYVCSQFLDASVDHGHARKEAAGAPERSDRHHSG